MAAKRASTPGRLGSNRLPGQGLNGIRFTFAGSPAISLTSARASASLSFTPRSMMYSKVMRRAFDAEG